MKFFNIKLITLAFISLISASYADQTLFQIIGTIEVEDNGTVRVYTPDNATKWGVSGCAEPSYMVISNSHTARDKIFSMLLLAKASGNRVRFHYPECSAVGSTTKVELQ